MKNLNKQKGFTLIEILIAMGIISLIAMAFFTIVNTSIKSNMKNEKDIKLLNITTSEIENIREQIKDTTDDGLVVNTTDGKEENNISIQWNDSDKISSVNGNERKRKIIKYTSIENVKYNVTLDMTREDVGKTKLYLYSVNIVVKLEDNNFSKREVSINTEIFGK